MTLDVNIEVIVSNIFKDHISYTIHNINNLTTDPDNAVINYLKNEGLIDLNSYIVHSTSWRYKKPDCIILTYLVVIPIDSEIVLNNILDIRKTSITNNNKTFKPRPEFIRKESVIRHAFRHLAYLIKHDYKNLYKKLLTEDQKKYILNVYDEVAEEITALSS